jgi:hypothetical protein
MPLKFNKSIAVTLQIVLGAVFVATLSLFLNMVAGLPRLSDWAKSHSLRLITAAAAAVVLIIAVEIWRQISSKPPKASPIPEDLTAYRQFLIEYKCNALQLAVMHPSAQELNRKVLLWSIFVPQSARESAPIPEIPPEIQRKLREEGHLSKLSGEDELAELRARYQSSPVRPIFEILDNNRLVAVVGDPGSGKSSLLRYRALRWAKDDLGPLPLSVRVCGRWQESG